MLFRKFSFYLALIGVSAATMLVLQLRKTPARPVPLAEPARSPYANAVAGTGIIESVRENVNLASPRSGLIKTIHVQVGSRVKFGDPLLQLDDRESIAQLAMAQAQLETVRASLAQEKVLAADAADQFRRADNLERVKVASEDERTRKQFALQSMEASVKRMQAQIRASEAQVQLAQTNLEILTVRAPRDGTILQVKVREGEFANNTPTDPIMILGDTDKLQLRADIDEQNAPMVRTNQPAVAFLKGDTENPIPLRFVRIEPFVIPKRSLTGDTSERVDTRVLQVIFQFDRPATPLYVGQQMDVFIERPSAMVKK